MTIYASVFPDPALKFPYAVCGYASGSFKPFSANMMSSWEIAEASFSLILAFRIIRQTSENFHSFFGQ